MGIQGVLGLKGIKVYISIQGIHGYTRSTWVYGVYREYPWVTGYKGIHKYTGYTWVCRVYRVYMSMDILLLLYETVGLFGVSVT